MIDVGVDELVDHGTFLIEACLAFCRTFGVGIVGKEKERSRSRFCARFATD